MASASAGMAFAMHVWMSIMGDIGGGDGVGIESHMSKKW